MMKNVHRRGISVLGNVGNLASNTGEYCSTRNEKKHKTQFLRIG